MYIYQSPVVENESKNANWNHHFQVQVDFPSHESPKKRTQQALGIAYMIPQKKIHQGRKRIPSIEGAQQYRSNSTIYPM